jgi:hypothetical protein
MNIKGDENAIQSLESPQEIIKYFDILKNILNKVIAANL